MSRHSRRVFETNITRGLLLGLFIVLIIQQLQINNLNLMVDSLLEFSSILDSNPSKLE